MCQNGLNLLLLNAFYKVNKQLPLIFQFIDHLKISCSRLKIMENTYVFL